jgi:translation initiation factor IF-2
MFSGGGVPGMPPIPGMRRATKKAAKSRKAPAKKKPKGGRPGAPPRPAGAGGQGGGFAPDGLRGAGRGVPEPGRGGPSGGLPAGLGKPGAGDDLAVGLEALARGNPGFLVVPEDDQPKDGTAPTDLPAGFGRFRRGKRGDR